MESYEQPRNEEILKLVKATYDADQTVVTEPQMQAALNNLQDVTKSRSIKERASALLIRYERAQILNRLRPGDRIEDLTDSELSILYTDQKENISVCAVLKNEMLRRKMSEDQVCQLVLNTFIDYGKRGLLQIAQQGLKEGLEKGLSLYYPNLLGTTIKSVIKYQAVIGAGFIIAKIVWNASKWLMGYQTYEQCKKNILGSICSDGISMVFQIAIGAITFANPVGIILGGVSGIIGALLGEYLNDKFWSWRKKKREEDMQREIIEDAAKTLGGSINSSFEYIQSQWKSLIILYHPDKAFRDGLSEEELDVRRANFDNINKSFHILRAYFHQKKNISEDAQDQIMKLTSDYRQILDQSYADLNSGQ